jgi:hypothetical protein
VGVQVEVSGSAAKFTDAKPLSLPLLPKRSFEVK